MYHYYVLCVIMYGVLLTVIIMTTWQFLMKAKWVKLFNIKWIHLSMLISILTTFCNSEHHMIGMVQQRIVLTLVDHIHTYNLSTVINSTHTSSSCTVSSFSAWVCSSDKTFHANDSFSSSSCEPKEHYICNKLRSMVDKCLPHSCNFITLRLVYVFWNL